MPALMNLILRVVLVVAGLVFAASLAVVTVLLLVGWTLRAGWAKLTGKSVTPFIVRIDPRRGFEQMYRGAAQGSRTPRADSVQPARNIADVTDVEPRMSDR
jgi:flagellar biosynthesis protein FlhB